MRRDSPTGLVGKSREFFEPRNAVPRHAKGHKHIALFFHAERGRTFYRDTKGAVLANEMTRNLRPWAREALLG